MKLEKSQSKTYITYPKEKRHHDRAFLTIAVTVEIGEQIIQCAECSNLSQNGMLIYTDQDISVGTRGTVTLTKKCSKRNYTFSAAFEVVRKEKNKTYKYGLGIKFRQLHEEDEKSLRYILDYSLTRAFRKKFFTINKNAKELHFKIADTKEELEQAFNIVHDTYVKEGYIDPQPYGMRLSIYHSLPFTTTFVGKSDDEVIITCTLFLESELGLPIDKMFSEEINKLRKNQRLIAEIGAFAVRPGQKNQNVNNVIHLHKMIIEYATKFFNIDDLVITINPKHQGYYKYVWLFDRIGQEKRYAALKNQPVIALRYNLRTKEKQVKESYSDAPPERNLHHFVYEKKCKSFEWPTTQAAPSVVWDRSLLTYFFEEKTSIFHDTSKEVLAKILKFYD
ncbi:Dinucleotide-utilizing enzyme involved in molybdopterin and thiamine biosynthesis family 2 [Chitinispirillum alkaliphilum]|nr:Dinucleotide-utilizing enzyme involved in molybdopterin and thiamine biosynthesis family 2 [Chitinispirillum alkaliphilum]